MVVDCGSLRFTVPKIRAGWVERDPSTKDQVEGMDFGAVDKRYCPGEQSEPWCLSFEIR